jgi:hypothetical protein
MDFGGFILFGCIALVFLAYIPIVIFAYIRKNPKIRLHIAFVVAMAGILIASGLFLRQVYFLDEPLAIAASQGDISTVQYLLDRGASPNAEGVDGISTALIDASIYNYKAIVQMLLSEGADVNQTDSEGKTALQRASQEGNEEIVQTLKRAGAK